MREAGDLGGQRLGRRAGLAGCDDTIGQADGERLVCGDRAAGEDQVEGATGTDDARQAHRAAVDQWHTPAPAEDTQDGVGLKDAQVAPQRELKATGNREAADRGDDRLVQGHPARPHRAVRAEVGVERVGHRVQVRAGAERSAGSPEHGHPRRGVGVEFSERVG